MITPIEKKSDNHPIDMTPVAIEIFSSYNHNDDLVKITINFFIHHNFISVASFSIPDCRKPNTNETSKRHVVFHIVIYFTKIIKIR